jgi:hypothetical protein
MRALPNIQPAKLIGLVCLAGEFGSFFLFYTSLRFAGGVSEYAGVRDANLVGQEGPWPICWGIGLIGLLYVGRFMVIREYRDTSPVIFWQYVLLATSLPPLWLLVALDWHNPDASRAACWVGVPIAFLFVPAISTLVTRSWLGSLNGDTVFSCLFVEAIVLVPGWWMFWRASHVLLAILGFRLFYSYTIDFD